MNWLSNARRTALFMSLCAVFAGVQAKTFDQSGPAPATLAPLSTYGVDVSTKTALKSVVPAGWQLFVHRSVSLPASMSWRTGVTWPQALSEFVAGTDVSVHVDWERKAVYFRPVALAVEDAAKRTMVEQAASTPLPALATVSAGNGMAFPELARNSQPPAPVVDPSVVNALEAKVVALEASLRASRTKDDTEAQELTQRLAMLENALREKSEGLAQAKEEAMAAKESAQKAQQAADALLQQQAAVKAEVEQRIAAATKVALGRNVSDTEPLVSAANGATLGATPTVPAMAAATTTTATVAGIGTGAAIAVSPDDLSEYVLLSAARSFNRVPVREVAKYMAEVHRLHLVMEGPEVDFRGPVTILGGDPAEDMRLMHKALGVAGGVSFELYRDEGIIKVVSHPQRAEKSYARVSEDAYSGPLPAQPPAVVATPLTHAPALLAKAPTLVMRPAVEPPKVNLTPPAPVPEQGTPVEKTVVATALSARKTDEVVASDYVPKVEDKNPAAAMPAKLVLHIDEGADLQDSLTAFLQQQGYEVRWTVDETFQATSPFTGEGASIVEVLSLLLPKLGLSADVQQAVKRVTVRSADPVRDAQ